MATPKDEPCVTDMTKGEDYTKVTFIPDFEKFKMTGLDDDIIALMSRSSLNIICG